MDSTAAKHSRAETDKTEHGGHREVGKEDREVETTDQYTVATGETFPMLLVDTASVILTASNAGVPVYQGPSQFAFVLDDTAPWTFTGRDLTLEHESLYGPGGALSEVFGTKAELVAEEFYSEEMKALGYDMMFCDANGLTKRLKANTLATNMLLTGGKGTRHIGHAVYGPVVLVSMKTLEMEQSNHSEDIEDDPEGSEEDGQEEDYEEHEQDEDYEEEGSEDSGEGDSEEDGEEGEGSGDSEESVEDSEE